MGAQRQGQHAPAPTVGTNNPFSGWAYRPGRRVRMLKPWQTLKYWIGISIRSTTNGEFVHLLKITPTLGALLLTLSLPIGVQANEGSDRLAKELDKKVDCAAIDIRIRAFLDQNADHFASLQKLADSPRKKEMRSYRNALEKAEAVTAKCEKGHAREIDAKFNTPGSDPVQIAGFYPRVTATLEFILEANSNDPFVYEQLIKSYEDLRAAYARIGKLGKPVYN
jgi:hypothetical protein